MNWNNADNCDKILYSALSLLYEKNENLLHLLLNPDKPCLRGDSEMIKRQSRSLSSGDELLIRIGLDVWNSSGGINFNELYQGLDQENFQKMILALNYLFSPGKVILY